MVVVGVEIILSEPKRHHYVPIFYLKQWVGSDHRLCEYSRPFKETKAKRKHPSATAYVEGLYTIPGVTPEYAQIIEKVVMDATDNTAAQAMRHLLQRKVPDQIPLPMKEAWARFLYSLILRSPEHLEWAAIKLAEFLEESVDAVRDDYLSRRTEDDPATFEEFRIKFLANPVNRSPARHMDRFMSTGLVIKHIMGMRWFTATFIDARFPMLTSDRPIIMTNGFSKPDSHIVIPISPTQLFFSANNEETAQKIRSIKPRTIVEIVNSRVSEQARKYIYGIDDRQLRFVAKRLGKMLPSTPLG